MLILIDNYQLEKLFDDLKQASDSLSPYKNKSMYANSRDLKLFDSGILFSIIVSSI